MEQNMNLKELEKILDKKVEDINEWKEIKIEEVVVKRCHE